MRFIHLAAIVILATCSSNVTAGNAWTPAPVDDIVEICGKLYGAGTSPTAVFGFTVSNVAAADGSVMNGDCILLVLQKLTPGDTTLGLTFMSTDSTDTRHHQRIKIGGLAFGTWYDVRIRLEKVTDTTYRGTAWWKSSTETTWHRFMDYNRNSVAGRAGFAPNYVGTTIMNGASVDQVRIFPRHDDFESYTAGQMLPWEDASASWVTSGVGYNSSKGIDGGNDDLWTYGHAWRPVEYPKGVVEVTGRLYGSSSPGWPVAYLGVTPDKRTNADGSFLANDCIYLVLAKDNVGDSTLSLALSSQDCDGGNVSVRIVIPELSYNQWYDVKMRVERVGAQTFEATAWYRESGTADWIPVSDAERDRVTGYADFVPNYVATSVMRNGYIDDVEVGPLDPLTEFSKKGSPSIIEFGWSSVDTAYLRNNVADMELRPLDGVSVHARYPSSENGTVWNQDSLGWDLFKYSSMIDAKVAPAIADLHATSFQKFDSNYIATVSYLGHSLIMDWFNDSWCAAVANNWKQMAKVAKQGGCKGILFDPEEYAACYFWSWPIMKDYTLYQNRTYEQVSAKVRQRGREFMTAINQVYPGVHLLSLQGWSTVNVYIRVNIMDSPQGFSEPLPLLGDQSWLSKVKYGLLVPFFDGMLEVADDQTIITDGIESGYYLESITDFVDKAQDVRRYGRQLSSIPDKFDEKVRTGFGIYLDSEYQYKYPWDPVNVSNNYWTPARLTEVVTNALLASDGLAWIYHEKMTWWLDSAGEVFPSGDPLTIPGAGLGDIKWIPQVYWSAVEQARKDATALGSVTVATELADYIGDFTLVPIRIELIQGGTVTRTEEIRASGNPTSLTLENVPAGTYDVAVSAPKWLKKIQYGVNVTSGNTDVNVSLANGDVNGDNGITSTDLNVILSNM